MERQLAHLQSLVARTSERITLEEGRVPADTSKKIAVQLSEINRHKDDFERMQTQANSRYYKAEAEWEGLESSSKGLIRRASERAGEQALADPGAEGDRLEAGAHGDRSG